jgi:hypothetical protein
VPARALGQDHVGRERERARERGGDAEPVERTGPVRLDDEEAARHRQGDRVPEAGRDPPAEPEPQPQEDEQRREVLDRDGGADLEAVDGQEVGGLHGRERDDAEQRELRDRRALDAQQPRAEQGDAGQEQHERACDAQLRDRLPAEPAVHQRRADARVDRPQRGGRGGEGVAEPHGGGDPASALRSPRVRGAAGVAR